MKEVALIPPELEAEDLEPDDLERPIIYVTDIQMSQSAEANRFIVNFSDGSQQMHRENDSMMIVALQHWMLNKTPLHRFDTGTLIEAGESSEHYRLKMFEFFKRVFDERGHSAKKFANGSMTTLDEIDDKVNGAADFTTYIAKYASSWYVGFPPHNEQALVNFRIAMVKVANLAFSGFNWANRRLQAMEIQARAQAAGQNRANVE